MSNSKAATSVNSPPEQYELRLPADRDAAVTVYDAGDAVVWAGDGGGTVVLPRGLYTVRMELNRQIVERPVRLTGARDLSRLAPVRYTAAPLKGAAISHEYYSYTSQDLSLKETRPPLVGAGPPDAGLFIFLRAVDTEHAKQLGRLVGQGVELRDANGEVVSRMDASECAFDTAQGWLAFSTQAPHGYYRLADVGDRRREMALHLFPQWQTQVFLLWTDRPVLEGARIFVQRPGGGFRFEEEAERDADLALDALASGTGRVSRRAMNALYSSKFENPMLGLIGAYTDLQRLRRLPETERQAAAGDAREMLNIVNSNLGKLVPDSPDVHALEVYAAEMFGQPVPQHSFRQPPMFRAGLDAVVRSVAKCPDLLPSSSDVDDIARNLFTDSVWTTWRPFAADPVRRVTRSVLKSAMPNIVLRADFGGKSAEKPVAPAEDVHVGKPFEPTWIQSGFLSALQTEQARLRRAGEKHATPRVEVARLAAQLRVSPRAIEEAVAEMDALDTDEVKAVLESGWDSLASLIDPDRPGAFLRFA